MIGSDWMEVLLRWSTGKVHERVAGVSPGNRTEGVRSCETSKS